MLYYSELRSHIFREEFKQCCSIVRLMITVLVSCRTCYTL